MSSPDEPTYEHERRMGWIIAANTGFFQCRLQRWLRTFELWVLPPARALKKSMTEKNPAAFATGLW
jgi:hypothetical protein